VLVEFPGMLTDRNKFLSSMINVHIVTNQKLHIHRINNVESWPITGLIFHAVKELWILFDKLSDSLLLLLLLLLLKLWNTLEVQFKESYLIFITS